MMVLLYLTSERDFNLFCIYGQKNDRTHNVYSRFF